MRTICHIVGRIPVLDENARYWYIYYQLIKFGRLLPSNCFENNFPIMRNAFHATNLFCLYE
jgi:hypothetical protein